MRKFLLVSLVVALGLTVAAPAEASAANDATAHAAKKKCKKKGGAATAKKKCKKKAQAPVPVAPPVAAPPPAPLALTAGEVINRVIERAGVYCAADPDCFDWGYYFTVPDPGDPFCSSRSTYTWSCFGWNDGNDGVDDYTCDFREIVSRSGLNGITSQLDTTFGVNGFDCYYLGP